MALNFSVGRLDLSTILGSAKSKLIFSSDPTRRLNESVTYVEAKEAVIVE